MTSTPPSSRSSARGLVILDTTGPGGPYDPDGSSAAPWTVYLDTDPDTGLPVSTQAGQALPESRNWRLHRLPGTLPSGQLDQRLALSTINDGEGPYDLPGPDDAPGGQTEHYTARNRSTREVDLYGRSALPSSQRRLVDSEDGRYVLSLVLGDAPPVPAGPAAGSAPATPTALEGVAFSEAGVRGAASGGGVVSASQPSVSISDTGGALTFFGAAAVQAAREAIAAGGSKGDVAAWAAAAAQGKPRPALEATRTRSPAPAPAAPAPIARTPSARPGGYTLDDQGKVGLLSTVFRPSLSSAVWHRGREGTRIGPEVIRADAQFGKGPDGAALVGSLRFVSEDASAIPEGKGKKVQGYLAHDRSRANEDTGVGDETGRWVVVVALDPSDLEFPPTNFIASPGGGPKGKGAIKGVGAAVGGGGPPGGINVPNPFDPSGPYGKGLLPFPPETKGKQNVITDPGGGLGDWTPGPFQGGDGVPWLPGDGVQARDLDGPSVPCGNMTGGLMLGNDQQLFQPQPGHPAVSINDQGTALIGGSTVLNGLASGGIQVETLPGGRAIGFGSATVASAPLPYPGTPGSPKNMTGWATWATATIRSLQAILAGAFGGPATLAANMAVLHRNSATNPPAASTVGAVWTAQRGQQLSLSQPAYQVVQRLEGKPGGQLTAEWQPSDTQAGRMAGVQEVVRRATGAVLDNRPLVQLVNNESDHGGVTGDLLATPGREFRVSKDHEVAAGKLEVLVDQRKPIPEHPLAVGNLDPRTGEMLGAPTWSVRQDGASSILDLSDTPDPPESGAVLVYSKNGAVYQQTEDGTETALGSASGVTIQEEDGLPSGTLTTLKLPNGSLTDNGGGSFSADVLQSADVGSTVQGWDSLLDDFAALTPVAGQFVGFDGGGALTVASAGGVPSMTDKQILYASGTTPTAGSFTAALDYVLGSSGEGALLRSGSTWSGVGTNARNFVGANSSGTSAYHGKVDFTYGAASAADSTFGELEHTASGGGGSWLTMDRQRASGSDTSGATDRYGIRWQRTGTTIGYTKAIEADGTNTYDHGIFADASEVNKFLAFDRSLNGSRIVSDGGQTMLYHSGTYTTPASGYGAFFFNSSGVPMGKNASGTEYQMVGGPAADPGDPSGFTTLGEMITWAGALRTNMQAAGAGLMS